MKSSKLEFQDFDLGSPSPDSSVAIDVNEQPDKILRTEFPSENERLHSKESFWTFKFYKQFFDVNTVDVKERIFWSILPSRGVSYLETYIRPNPDLYGPIWICTTLVFTIAVGGNVADYLQSAGEPKGSNQWKYDFHLISNAATAIFSYAFLVPLLLYTMMTWKNSIVSISFLELLCTFGYALSIYVPLSILWVIQVPWFQWSLVVVGALRSGYGLVSTVHHCVYGAKKILVGMITLAMHFLWSFGLMWYVFYVNKNSQEPSVTEAVPVLNATHNS